MVSIQQSQIIQGSNLPPKQPAEKSQTPPLQKEEQSKLPSDSLKLKNAAKGALVGGLAVYTPIGLSAAALSSAFADNFAGGLLEPFREPGIATAILGATLVGGVSAYMASDAQTAFGGFGKGLTTGAVVGSAFAGIATAVTTRNPGAIAKAALLAGPVLGGLVGGMAGMAVNADKPKY